jgi:hypothetical protein
MTLDTRAPTETASQLFGEQVQQIPGVLRVERSSDDLTGRKSFRVTIRKGDREARYAVYRLEADMYIRYEGASLDIRVVEEADAAQVGSDSPAAVG